MGKGTYKNRTLRRARFFGKAGIKRTLFITFSLLLALVFFFIGGVTLRTYQSILSRTLDTLAQYYAENIRTRIEGYLRVPITISETEQDFFTGPLKPSLEELPSFFSRQLERFPMVHILAVGYRDGEYAEAQRLSDGRIRMGRAGRSTGGALSFFTLDSAGRRIEQQRSGAYDPRKRPWYVDAAAQGRLSFSQTYHIVSTDAPVVAVENPFFDHGGTLQGVSTVTISLEELGKTVADIAHSTGAFISIRDGGGNELIAPDISLDFTDHPGDRLENSVQRIVRNGVPYRTYSLVYQGQAKANWKITIGLAEKDFFVPLRKTLLWLSGLYVFILLVVMILVYTLILTINSPLGFLRTEVLRLYQNMGKASADSEDYELLEALGKRKDELGQLANTFLSLSKELKISLDTLKDSVREKDVLLKEVHHRVKNNLQVISSLVNLHADSVDDEKIQGVLKELGNKVYSMALVHEVLYASGEFSSLPMDVYISRLAENLSSFAPVTTVVSLEVHTEPISLPLDQAIPCGLILVELMTNAYKYAFNENQRGAITIDFRRLDGHVELAVGDDGQGFDTEAVDAGMGSTIVRALTEQIKGRLSVVSGAQGTRVSILFSP